MTEEELKKRLEIDFRKHQEFLASLTPEELRQYNNDVKETKEKLAHCVADGLSVPRKIIIENFLYLLELKDDEHINKILIQRLAWFSEQNLILRYFLIEAGLRNQVIEKYLQETNFYKIPNNPDKFYSKPKNIIPEEERLANHELQYHLYRLGLQRPIESSRQIIQERLNKIIGEKIDEFIQKLSESLYNDIEALIASSNNKSLTRETFLEGFKFSLKYFIDQTIENEFNLKNHRSTEGFILFLNEMYWLLEENFQKIFGAYLYLPNMLLNFSIGEKDISHIISIFHNREIKVNELSRNNKYYELFIYAYFRYYLNKKGTTIPAEKYSRYYGGFYAQKLLNKRYNQIHSLIDSNYDLHYHSYHPNDIPYDFYSGNHHQQFRSWIKANKKNPIFREFEDKFSLF